MIEARGVTKRFGSFKALDGVSLAARKGEFLSLLGPSGCGKTTLLRIFAGLEQPDAGSILLDGTDVTARPAYCRDVNQVFQSYALFPHLSVRDNIGFGLKMRGIRARERKDRVAEAIAAVTLAGLEDRRPHQLSGGQRQRVAVARAIVCRPKVLLLDEPLSALDAKLRIGMQDEFRRLHRKLGLTMVYVTHDQQEALSMSDRVAILNAGRIEQVGTPEEIYRKPSTPFSADFVGHANLAEAEVLSLADATAVLRTREGVRIEAPASRVPSGAAAVIVSLRPEDVMLSIDPQTCPNVFAAAVLERAFQGAADRILAVTDGGMRLVILAAGPGARRTVPRPGQRIYCSIRPEDVVVLPFQPAGRFKSPLSESQSAIL